MSGQGVSLLGSGAMTAVRGHESGFFHRKGDLPATAASNVTGPADAGGRTTELERT